MNNILIIIPARGNSKGIPRKNIRNLGGRPLIYYVIHNALSLSYEADVFVTSEDDEILNLSKKFGAKAIKRIEKLSQDDTTLDSVVYDAYKSIKEIENKNYELIITMQPTSPILKAYSIDQAIKKICDNDNIDTIISAVENTHLCWRRENNIFFPNYKIRLNRQYLDPTYGETGGFLITRESILISGNRIGKNVDLYLLKNGEEIDIDTYEDWSICEYILKRKKVLFVVTGHKEVGMGHVYNALILANDLINHDICFLVDKKSSLAYEKILESNYTVYIQKSVNFTDDVLSHQPDLVINDILDTKYHYILELKEHGIKVVNFEDIGPGSRLADAVINAIYNEYGVFVNSYYGQKYYLLRDEFYFSTPTHQVNKTIKKVLLTFGGADPSNYAKYVLESIYEYCLNNNIELSLILGFGYKEENTLDEFNKVKIYKDTINMFEHINSSDIVFGSAGRTTYEIAYAGTPAIILAQNERELEHKFAFGENGFINLGLINNLTKNSVLKTFIQLAEDYDLRKHMSTLMKSNNLKNGRKVVRNIIEEVLEKK